LNSTNTSSIKSLARINIIWWVVCAGISTYILRQQQVTYTQAITESVITFGLLGSTCMFIINNMRYYLPKQEKYYYVIIISLAISLLCLLLSKMILKLLFGKDANFLRVFEAAAGVRFGILFLSAGCMSMIGLLWYTQEEQQLMNERKTDAEKMAKEAELYKLRQQLQPHFLFNSLNSISALTGTQPEKARHMIQQLSDFLRGTLRKDEHQWSTLKEELEYLGLYLDIEKVRFGHRLQTTIACAEGTLEMKLPSLLLQPVVENAIKFGLYDTVGEVCIQIEAKAVKGMLQITVQNPYDPETSQPLQGTGFGLASIKRRLFLLFARHDLLQTQTAENIFITNISVPQVG
jgi:two-component system LytT family sensor kinase